MQASSLLQQMKKEKHPSTVCPGSRREFHSGSLPVPSTTLIRGPSSSLSSSSLSASKSLGLTQLCCCLTSVFSCCQPHVPFQKGPNVKLGKWKWGERRPPSIWGSHPATVSSFNAKTDQDLHAFAQPTIRVSLHPIMSVEDLHPQRHRFTNRCWTWSTVPLSLSSILNFSSNKFESCSKKPNKDNVTRCQVFMQADWGRTRGT
jgi:hypothetical protein